VFSPWRNFGFGQRPRCVGTDGTGASAPGRNSWSFDREMLPSLAIDRGFPLVQPRPPGRTLASSAAELIGGALFRVARQEALDGARAVKMRRLRMFRSMRPVPATDRFGRHRFRRGYGRTAASCAVAELARVWTVKTGGNLANSPTDGILTNSATAKKHRQTKNNRDGVFSLCLPSTRFVSRSRDTACRL